MLERGHHKAIKFWALTWSSWLVAGIFCWLFPPFYGPFIFPVILLNLCICAQVLRQVFWIQSLRLRAPTAWPKI